MAETLYTIDILRLATTLDRWPRLADEQAAAERRSVTCGSKVRAGVRVDEAGRLAAIGLTVSACALGQASAAIMAAEARGRDGASIRSARAALAAFLAGTAPDLPDWPGVAVLAPARGYPARHASILLPFDAVLGAIEDAVPALGGECAHG